MMAASRDFQVWRGATGQIKIRPKNADGSAFDHAGSVWRLTIGQHGATPLYDGAAAPDGDGWLVWELTPAQTRAFALGAAYPYEVERRIGGDEEVWLAGMVRASGGINLDAAS